MMIDFHTHILPDIDDGSSSVEESIEMIRSEVNQGVDTIFLTPHFSALTQYPEQFLARRSHAMETLNAALSKESSIPNFVLGAEIMYSRGMSKWDELPQLALGDTGYILIEMQGTKWSESVFNELVSIYSERKLIPVVAHIERCFRPFHIRELLARLEKMPVLLQMNGSYITDRHTRKHALNLLKHRKVHLLGSDCHSSTWRKPAMDQVNDILMNSLDDSTLQYLSLIGQKVASGENVF
jgi:protein-tyrosine phosphatase